MNALRTPSVTLLELREAVARLEATRNRTNPLIGLRRWMFERRVAKRVAASRAHTAAPART